MPTTYQELYRNLVQEEHNLAEQLKDLEGVVREDGVGYSNHMADAATEVFEQARDVSVARQLRYSHSDVKHALEKFGDGTYGICEACGAAIELARLEALPSARYCLSCQSRHEAIR